MIESSKRHLIEDVRRLQKNLKHQTHLEFTSRDHLRLVRKLLKRCVKLMRDLRSISNFLPVEKAVA